MTTMTDGTNARPTNRWRGAVWGGAACLLALPFVAMQFTREVNWDAADFIFMGLMLLAACGTYELATRASGSTAYRAGVGLAVVASFLLIWINLAVGIIGSENNDLNGMFAAVLVVAVGGAIAVRGRAGAMAHVMTAAAVTQAIVGVAALVFGHMILPITAVFMCLWLGAGAMFRTAARGVIRSA